MSKVTVGGKLFSILFPDVVRPLTADERQGLRDSIAKYGVKTPVVVDESMGVIDGANRLAIASELGLEFVPFHVEAGLTHEQKQALAEDLNWERRQFSAEEQQARRRARISVVAGDRHGGMSLPAIGAKHGISVAQVQRDLQAAALPGGKAVPAGGVSIGLDGKTYPARRDPDAERRKREDRKLAEMEAGASAIPPANAPAWSIVTGDCISQLASIRGQARLIFADPPYNIGIDYGDGESDDLLPEDEYVAWARRWVAACHNALAPDGSLWILVSDECAAEYCLAIKAAGFTIRNWIKWYETFGVNCTNKFNRTSRHIFYAVKDPSSFVFHREAVSRPSDRQTKYNDPRASPDGKILDDVWADIPRLAGTHSERIPTFPTQLPVELLERIVRVASDPGDLIADPFNGSGTTGAAALRHDRRYFGVEKRENFAELARKRLRATLGELFAGKE